MVKIWNYIRLFFVSMGMMLILLVLYSAIKIFFGANHKNVFEYYNTLVDYLSNYILTWNSFFASTIIFFVLLIYYKGKTPFPEDKFWLK